MIFINEIYINCLRKIRYNLKKTILLAYNPSLPVTYHLLPVYISVSLMAKRGCINY